MEIYLFLGRQLSFGSFKKVKWCFPSPSHPISNHTTGALVAMIPLQHKCHLTKRSYCAMKQMAANAGVSAQLVRVAWRSSFILYNSKWKNFTVLIVHKLF